MTERPLPGPDRMGDRPGVGPWHGPAARRPALRPRAAARRRHPQRRRRLPLLDAGGDHRRHRQAPAPAAHRDRELRQRRQHRRGGPHRQRVRRRHRAHRRPAPLEPARRHGDRPLSAAAPPRHHRRAAGVRRRRRADRRRRRQRARRACGWSTTSLPRDCLLVFGQEGPGITDDARAGAALTVSIAQFGSTRSINAAVAAGIAMHAWIAQHADLIAGLVGQDQSHGSAMGQPCGQRRGRDRQAASETAVGAAGNPARRRRLARGRASTGRSAPGTTGGRRICWTAWSTRRCATRSPSASRRSTGRSGGIGCATTCRWTNDYYDDMAWLALALERAGRLAASSGRRRWRRWPTSSSTPGCPRTAAASRGASRTSSSTPRPTVRPAIFLARYDDRLRRAQQMADWIDETLIDPETHLVFDGIKARLAGARAVHLLPGRGAGPGDRTRDAHRGRPSRRAGAPAGRGDRRQHGARRRASRARAAATAGCSTASWRATWRWSPPRCRRTPRRTPRRAPRRGSWC